ncbi:flavin monoamine oxidase family protein [Sorangium sp. So ce1182]|uniref:flavin monoamine oxidase family protein n=1 Tax=Sorangium sp. So ce1182 TaxID=3133334 RepID=UPI003F6451C3
MSVKMMFNPGSQMETKVAVVGGGVAGLYSAWRLAVDSEHFLPNQVKVFEFGNRVGGRLETIHLDHASERRAEVGGMRFIPSWQLHVAGLVKRLELEAVPFPMGNDSNLLLLRGTPFRDQSFKYGTIPYRLRGSEQGFTPNEIFVYVINALLASVGKSISTTKGLSREEWDLVKKDPNFKFDGRPVHEQGFWNILSKLLSSEAYKLLTDASGYFTLTSNWNAAEAASFIGLDFIGADYMTLADGYDMHAAKLAQQFTEAGGEIWGCCELIRFEKRKDGKLRLIFRNRKRTADGADGEQTFEVTTEHLVLAMPRHGLERLQLHGTRFDFESRANVEQKRLRDSVLKMPAFKLFMAYESPWWSRLGLESGRSISDLPIRQTYYFGTDAGGSQSLLMTSYADAGTVSFWKGLGWKPVKQTPDEQARGEPGSEGRPKYISRNTVATGCGDPDTYEATPEMIRHATLQLQELHGVEVKAPIATCYKDWSAEPFGAGWYLWKSGTKSWEVMPAMRRPWPKEKVYVCGDCYSNLQGWVEGALNTAELLLNEHFGMQRPGWLGGIYLGY